VPVVKARVIVAAIGVIGSTLIPGPSSAQSSTCDSFVLDPLSCLASRDPADVRGGGGGVRVVCVLSPSPIEGGGTLTPDVNGQVLLPYVRSCDDGSAGVLVWLPYPPDPGVFVPGLVQRVTAQLPSPVPRQGFPVPSIVGLPTGVWVDRGVGQWAPVSARAEIPGGVWAEATARPVALVVDSGQDVDPRRRDASESEPVRCTDFGPYSGDVDDPFPCSVLYTHVPPDGAEGWEARVSIVWQIDWVGSGGRGGSIGQRTTTTTVTFPVTEIQAVVTIGD
jgi:hypothetical protein